MILNITQEDIENGLQRNPRNCAIAKAFKRIMDNSFLDVAVYYKTLELNGKQYNLPQNATDFIRNFDCEGPYLDPITIEIPELV